ncbi:MAG: hypothetical protein KGJ87_10755 [Planctomycetota bacterium]|nr:hypothetical protein [Planctomycetota bacterium]MDE1890166.1 hypothetical protein [Planctomycetota bacterium]MDE2217622.1 hypothetical protein [Planctomycetota bacterium]
MILDVNCSGYSVDNQRRKIERLAFIKERYKKLVLEPRKEIEFEIEKALDDEDNELENL